MPFRIFEIAFGSQAYRDSVDLRSEILRKPLGLQFSTQDLSADDKEYHLSAWDNENLIGILLLKPINSKVIKMRQVAIATNYQGKGIGSELVRFSEQFSHKKGFDHMELHARKTAVAFYQKLNYEIVGTEFEEVGIPHFKMSKNLVG